MKPSAKSLEEARKILHGCVLTNFCPCECHKTMSIPGSVVDAIALALDAKVLECAKIVEDSPKADFTRKELDKITFSFDNDSQVTAKAIRALLS